MKKFKVTVNCDYVAGYLKYGYLEGIVEAKNAKEIIKNLKNYEDCLDLTVTGYSVSEYKPDYSSITVEEVG